MRHCRLLPCSCILIGLLAGASVRAQLLSPNLRYNVIEPCRLVDTRAGGAGGPLVPGTPRKFDVVGVSLSGSLQGQGGNPQGCPIPGFNGHGFPEVQAVAVNLIAVGPQGAGDLAAWPSDSPQPATSVLNYAPVPGLNIANQVILAVQQSVQGQDITVAAMGAATHLVIDVQGYFSVDSPAPATGEFNLFAGTGAGAVMTTGSSDTAIGSLAFQNNTAGSENTAVGASTLLAVQTGSQNTAVGATALASDQVGSGNTAVGAGTLIGAEGKNNTALGLNSGNVYSISESNNIVIGNNGTAGDKNTIRIGNGSHQAAYLAGVEGVTSSGGTSVFINSSGRLGTTTSSLRFKEEVADMGEASADLMRLRPVTFHYKPAYDDGSRLLQYGLIAEEVATIYPQLVEYDKDGAPFSVRYHFVNAMLLNEVQKQHAQIAKQAAQLDDQRALLSAEGARRDHDREGLNATIASQAARLHELEERLTRLESRADPTVCDALADN